MVAHNRIPDKIRSEGGRNLGRTRCKAIVACIILPKVDPSVPIQPSSICYNSRRISYKSVFSTCDQRKLLPHDYLYQIFVPSLPMAPFCWTTDTREYFLSENWRPNLFFIKRRWSQEESGAQIPHLMKYFFLPANFRHTSSPAKTFNCLFQFDPRVLFSCNEKCASLDRIHLV